MKTFPDAILRSAGLSLMLIAAWTARTLFATADPSAKFHAINYLLAFILITTGSFGCALAGWGRHLFDQVTLSARWTIYQRDHRSAERGGRRFPGRDT